MTTFVQLLLAVVVTTLTFLVAFAGIQVFHILHDFRQMLRRLNNILDNTQAISDSAAKPITAVNEFFSEVKTLVNHTEDEIISVTPDRVVTPTTHSHPHAHIEPSETSKSPRFFRRAGSPLRS